MTGESSLVERLVDEVRAHLLAPPSGDDPVLRFGNPAEIDAAFAETVSLRFREEEPAHDPDRVVAAARQVIDWSVATAHPRFANQNFAGADPIGVVGDWLGAALNTTGATYEVAPVFTLMEHAVLDKLARLADFPTTGDVHQPPPGMFCPGGSVGLLFALQLARHRLDPDVTRRGADGTRYAVFVSEAGHYSTRKSAALLGLGTDAVVTVAVDRDGAMQPDALGPAIESAVAAGREPLAVIATAGTTVTAAFDPIAAIADECAARGLWLHVDGAYGGSALFSPDQRARLDGLARADSLVWDLHKMMGMTQQCSVLLVREPEQLDSCFAARADYLFQPDKRNAALDAGDRTFQCGRRTDVIKLWLAWKAHGDAGMTARVDHAVAVADHVRHRVDASGGRFAFTVRGDFTNTCILWVPPEARPLDLGALDDSLRNRLHSLAPAVKARMQDAGTAMVGYQPIDGLNCFRLLFMNPAVTVADADALLSLIDRYASEQWSS
jgi:glutamate/tyrosine decarboxylase-like PLP-dependent enzyme